MTFKGLAPLPAVALGDQLAGDQAVAVQAAAAPHSTGNAVELDGPDLLLVSPVLARRVTTITVSWFSPLSSFPFILRIVHAGLMLVWIKRNLLIGNRPMSTVMCCTYGLGSEVPLQRLALFPARVQETCLSSYV